MLTSLSSGSSSARITPSASVTSPSPSAILASKSGARRAARSTIARSCGPLADTVYSFGPPKPSSAGSTSTITTTPSVIPVEIRNERSRRRSVSSRRATSLTVSFT
jgi:hypothetical protein